MRIAEAAAVAGVSTRALRHDEDRGLLTPDRDRNGYRRYHHADLPRIANIRLLLAAGLTTEDAAELVGCLDGDVACASPGPVGVALAARRLAGIDGQIDRLVQVRDRLRTVLVAAGHNTDPPQPLAPPNHG